MFLVHWYWCHFTEVCTRIIEWNHCWICVAVEIFGIRPRNMCEVWCINQHHLYSPMVVVTVYVDHVKSILDCTTMYESKYLRIGIFESICVPRFVHPCLCACVAFIVYFVVCVFVVCSFKLSFVGLFAC